MTNQTTLEEEDDDDNNMIELSEEQEDEEMEEVEEISTDPDENSKYKFIKHEDVLKHIFAGVDPRMLRSDEAPHGYKQDGTPASQRGRKLGSGKKKVLANPKHGNAGKKLVKTSAAPYGVKMDGTPMKKRGRPSKNSISTTTPSQQTTSALPTPLNVSVNKALMVANKITVSKQQDQNTEINRAVSTANEISEKVYKSSSGTILSMTPERRKETEQETYLRQLAEILASREPAFEGTIGEGSKVRLVAPACGTISNAQKLGTVIRKDGRLVYVAWRDTMDWRFIPTLELSPE